jgi:molybdate transport system ATP-binding protein
MLGLDRLLTRRVHTLSGGERQRVALGRTLLSRPHILLMDEPLSSLDHKLRQDILPFLLRLRDAATVPMLYISHELSEILQLTDELLILDGGCVRAHGRYQSLCHNASALDTLHSRGLINVYAAVVLDQQPDSGITLVHLAGADGDASSTSEQVHKTKLSIPYRNVPIGAPLQISIQPADVALALERIPRISIRNQIAGTVTRCTQHDARALVEVDIGRPMISEVSLGTVASLDIRPGLPIWCLVKSNAIRTLY